MVQMIFLGVILAALTGAYFSWRSDIADQAQAEIVAEMEALQKKRDLENLRLAQEGKEDAERRVRAAQKRSSVAWANAETDAKTRKAASDARAKEDRDYALWREQPLPAYSAERLRNAAILGLAEDRGGVPARAPVSPPTVVPAAPNDERGTGGIRAFVNNAIAARMESVRAGAERLPGMAEGAGR